MKATMTFSNLGPISHRFRDRSLIV